jgi:thiamine-phosphate pyrophosphorylase
VIMGMNRRRIKQRLAVYLVLGLEDGGGKDAVQIARSALEGGITLLQLREKNAPLPQLLEVGGEIRDLCREYHVPFIVNDRIDVAMLLDADGVHVGQEDIPCRLARRLLGSDKLIGVSASTLEEARMAAQDGADYIGVGAIYATATKGDAGEPIGTSLITEIAELLQIPQVGIGGIRLDNAAAVIEAGADGIAVVSAITQSGDPAAAARKLLDCVMPLLAQDKNS